MATIVNLTVLTASLLLVFILAAANNASAHAPRVTVYGPDYIVNAKETTIDGDTKTIVNSTLHYSLTMWATRLETTRKGAKHGKIALLVQPDQPLVDYFQFLPATKFVKQTTFNGKPCNLFQVEIRSTEREGEVSSTYSVYATDVPLRIVMDMPHKNFRREIFIRSFSRGPIDPEVFKVPDFCETGSNEL